MCVCVCVCVGLAHLVVYGRQNTPDCVYMCGICCLCFSNLWIVLLVRNAIFKRNVLHLLRFIFIAFSAAHFPSLSRYICNFSVSSLLIIFIYYTIIIEKSNSCLSVPPNIINVSQKQMRTQYAPLRYTRCYSNFLPHFLSYFDSLRATQKNSLTNATTLESLPEIAIFISSRSCGTKSKASEKSIK